MPKKIEVVQSAPLPPEIAALTQQGFVSADEFDIEEAEVIPTAQEIPDALTVFSQPQEESVDPFESAMRYLVDEEGIFEEIHNEFKILKDFSTGSILGLQELEEEYKAAGEDVPQDVTEAIETAKAQEKLSTKQQEIIDREDVRNWFRTALRETVLTALSKETIVDLAAKMEDIDIFTGKVNETMSTLVQFVNITSQKELPEVEPFLQDSTKSTPIIQ